VKTATVGRGGQPSGLTKLGGFVREIKISDKISVRDNSPAFDRTEIDSIRTQVCRFYYALACHRRKNRHIRNPGSASDAIEVTGGMLEWVTVRQGYACIGLSDQTSPVDPSCREGAGIANLRRYSKKQIHACEECVHV
jgi:hypothetical protein